MAREGCAVKNALAYTSEGRIVIDIEPTAWTLSDTGAGFGRVESGREGFGIGLSLVERWRGGVPAAASRNVDRARRSRAPLSPDWGASVMHPVPYVALVVEKAPALGRLADLFGLLNLVATVFTQGE
ncbi:hypothetical protein [Archangium violaceum]|uniref:hypothetical protein n=1 Tax=Archangium violaceum TaxID=83451 RepID=UPI001EF50902|nr:hypothetical protein [Archangium violaceum]